MESKVPANLPPHYYEAERKSREARGPAEKVAEFDDAFMGAYLDGQTLTEDEVRAVVRKGTIAGAIFPVLCGSALILLLPRCCPVSRPLPRLPS